MIIRILLVLIALLLFLTRRKSGALIEAVLIRMDAKTDIRQHLVRYKHAFIEEEDELTAKGRWKLIIAGYVILILFAVFSTVSIFTLNQKINTLYGSVRSLEETVAELEQGAR